MEKEWRTVHNYFSKLAWLAYVPGYYQWVRNRNVVDFSRRIKKFENEMDTRPSLLLRLFREKYKEKNLNAAIML